MKRIFLAALLTVNSAFGADTVINTDKTKVGRKVSTADKTIEFNNSQATNAAISSTPASNDIKLKSSNVKVGSGAAADQLLQFNNGAGTLPQIKWNNSAGALQFSNDGTNFSDIGSGGSGGGTSGKNYADKNGQFESDVNGWTAFNTTFTGGVPGTITAGSTKVTLTQTATSPLSGLGSLKFDVVDASSSAGHGAISPVITVDSQDLAKVITSLFSYKFTANASNFDASGTSTETLEMWIYDVTAGTWTQPAGFRGINNKSGADFVQGTFQSHASNTQYRVAWIIKNAPSATGTLYFDNFYFGRVGPAQGAAVTDWVSNTCTSTWTTNTTTFCKSRRVGDHAQMTFSVSLTGAPNNTGLTFTLPSGMVMDTAKMLNAVDGYNGIGYGICRQGSTVYNVQAIFSSSSSFYAAYQNALTGAVNTFNATQPATFASGGACEFFVEFPVVGWSSNVQMSSDSDTRVVAFRAKANSGSLTGAYSDVTWNTVEEDNTGSFNGTTTWTVPVSGYYDVTGQIYTSSTTTASGNVHDIKLLKNGSTAVGESQYVFQGSSGGQAISVPFNFSSVKLNAGDTLKIQCANNSTTPIFNTASTQSSFQIKRISGPSQIAASENVSVSATNSSAQSIPNATNTTITGWTKIHDSHSSFNATSGVFTAPVSGKYYASMTVTMASGFTANTGSSNPAINQAGSLTTSVQPTCAFTSTTSEQHACTATFVFNMVAGDTLTLRQYQSNGAARSIDSSGARTYFSVNRLGN